MTRKGPKPTDWSKVKSRVCTKCGRRRLIRYFYWARGIPFSWCKDCEKKRVRKWQTCNKEKARTYSRISWLRLRQEIVEAYGGECQCCGETRHEFLVVDHKYNDGAKHRRQLGGKMFYHWLRRNGFLKRRFQLLCWNCNMAKAIHGRCPHEEK